MAVEVVAAAAKMSTHLQKNVRVCVRCRPFIKQELRKEHTGDLLQLSTDINTITVKSGRDGRQMERAFTYDSVLDGSTTQQQVFERCGVKDMVHKVADGFHATVFAYGQTSSGKTYTMEGYRYEGSTSAATPQVNFDVPGETLGLMPRAILEVFRAVSLRKQRGAGDHAPDGGGGGEQASQGGPGGVTESFRVRVSYVQIYMERVYDLLAPGGAAVQRGGDPAPRGGWTAAARSRQRRLRYDNRRGFFVQNLEWIECTDPQQALEALQAGVRNKIMASHEQNEASSRSHCIFQVEVERTAATGAEAAGVHVTGASQRICRCSLYCPPPLPSFLSLGVVFWL
jgi:hypothetical protein